MSVITGDPPGRPWLAPATQAAIIAGDGVQGVWRDKGVVGMALPSLAPKLSPGFGSVQSFPAQTPKPQVPIIVQAGLRRRLGRRHTSVSTCLVLRAGIVTSHIRHHLVLTCHLPPYCLSPPTAEPKQGDYLLSTYCIPDSMLNMSRVSTHMSVRQPYKAGTLITPFYR